MTEDVSTAVSSALVPPLSPPALLQCSTCVRNVAVVREFGVQVYYQEICAEMRPIPKKAQRRIAASASLQVSMILLFVINACVFKLVPNFF